MQSDTARKTKADRSAENNEQPAAPARQDIANEGDRRGRRVGAVYLDIKDLRRLDPGEEDHKQKKPERARIEGSAGERRTAKASRHVAASPCSRRRLIS